jgi:amino acid permease
MTEYSNLLLTPWKWDYLAYQCPTQLVIEHSSVLNILLWPRGRFLKKLPCEFSFFPVSLRETWKQMIMVLRIMHSRHWKDIVKHNFIFTLFCMKLIWSWIPQVPSFLKLTVICAQAYIPSFCKFSVYSFLDSSTLEDTRLLEYCEILTVFWNIYHADASATFFVLGVFLQPAGQSCFQI